jgi:integrase
MAEEGPTTAEIITRSGTPNPAYTYIASLASGTSRQTQASALKKVAEQFFHTKDPFSCDWASLRYEHMAIMKTWLSEKRRPATARRYLAAVKGVLKAAWKQGDITAEEYQRAISVGAIKGKSIAGLMLEPDQVQALLETCNKGGPTRGVRDAAILCLMFGCGLRRAEVAGLNMSDYDAVTGRLTVHGKGNKERTAYVANAIKDALLEWLKIRGKKPGAIFFAVVKGDEIFPRRVSNMSIWLMLKQRARAAGLPPKFAPHDARRTYISNMLNLTDLATAAKLAGHESPLTTARYDKRPEKVAQDAAGKLDVPYQKRGEV